MPALGVNIDHVATLRQVRLSRYPDPALAALLAQDAGADQITCHLREDRRHIVDADIPAIQERIQIPLNLEMAASLEMRQFALRQRPQKITLVPERRQELTTEGGLEVASRLNFLRDFLGPFFEAEIAISLFIDPDPEQVQASRELGVDAVEFHTGRYCEASGAQQSPELEKIASACRVAKAAGFFVAVGHGINYQNILPLRAISEIQEYNIGHSIVAHAVLVGLERAVREMKSLVV